MEQIPGGYYIKARCIKNSWIAHAAPVVRELWDYLLCEANHQDKKYNGFEVRRGQLFKSYREIREALSWKVGYRTERYHESAMKRAMNALMNERMIELTNEPRGNLITILNYDYYQDHKNYERTSEQTDERTKTEPRTDQHRSAINKNIKNERIEECKEEDSAPDGAGPKPEFYITKKKRKLSGKRLETFNIFWNKFNYPKGKAEAADSWLDIPQLTDSLVKTIYIAAEKEARSRPDLIKNGGSPKWAQGWITSKRWEDGEPIATDSPEAEAAEAMETERKRQELLKHYDRITAEKERERQATTSKPGSGTGVVGSTLFGLPDDPDSPGNGDGSE